MNHKELYTNLNEPGIDQMISQPNSVTITRRALLAGAGATVSAATLAAAIAPALATTSLPAPDYEDLTRYYAFLWSEFQALGDELGVGQHDSTTAHRNGDIDALKLPLSPPPSSRAMQVLTAMGVTRAEIPSQPHHRFQTSRPDADEQARTKLRRAARDIREAMSLLGHRDFMVFVKDEPGFRSAKVIDFRAGGESYAFA